MLSNHKLTPTEVAVLETFVIPRYLEAFGKLVVDAFLVGESARVAHLGCRTGYPDRDLIRKIPNCAVFGVDPSLAALELAKNKAATLGDALLEYHVAMPEESRLPPAVFSHAFILHPIADQQRRFRIFCEMARLVYVGGQVIAALPLQGSFQEIMDLLSEFALKFDDVEFANAVWRAGLELPSVNSLTEELDRIGFDDVYIEVEEKELEFDSGRAFVDDPAARLLILPALGLEGPSWERALAYLHDAINKYWSESKFKLSVRVGCATCRKH